MNDVDSEQTGQIEKLETFVLFKGRSLKINEKITAAWINLFIVYFDVSAVYAAILKK